MRLDDVSELFAWCVEHRVLHVQADGVTLTLDPSALPAIVMMRPADSKEPGWDDDLEQETPQERVRREFAEAQSPDAERDS